MLPFSQLHAKRMQSRVSVAKLCAEAGVNESTYWRALKDPKNGLLVTSLQKLNDGLERILERKAAERAALTDARTAERGIS